MEKLVDREEKKLFLVESVKLFFEENGRFPTTKEIETKYGISGRSMRRYFGGLFGLIQEVLKHVDEPLFNENKAKNVREAVKKYKKFLITTAVVGAPVNELALVTAKKYCKENKAALLIIPAADPAASVSEGLDENLLDELIVFENTKLNSNLEISAIKLSAKQIMPQTGLARIGQRNNSFIFASPKQNLEFVPVSNNSLPHALMTTGAITNPAYHTTRYMSKRTAYIADYDHVMGAIVVEIENDREYHFRQVQFDSDGSFIDLGKKYHSSKKTTKVNAEAIVLGDWHIGSTCPTVKRVTDLIIQDLSPKNLILHDCFNGFSINHHLSHRKLTKARMNVMSLVDELALNKEEFTRLKKKHKSKITVVKSNHDEWIDRYLEECRYIDDPVNFRIALELSIAKYDGRDPYEFSVNDPDIRFLKRDEDFIISGIQLGAHGDIEGSLVRVEKSFSRAVVGHSHSAAILRGVYRVGTSTKLREPYAKGPISWTNTHCVIYSNGQRQLINIINGKYKC